MQPPFSKHVPQGHVCVAVILRNFHGDVFTLCEYGHLVMAQARVNPVVWDDHLRQLHERTLTGRVGEPELPTTQEDQ